MKPQFKTLYDLVDALHNYALKGRDSLLRNDEAKIVGVQIRTIKRELARLQAAEQIFDELRREAVAIIDRVEITSQSGATILEALLKRIKEV